jgi:uncharacterized protein YxjI
MSDLNFLFETNEIVLKKKMLSVREHYDFEDLRGTKLGAAEGNILQFPPKFVLFDNHGLELMHLEGKMVSIRNQFTIYDNQGAELGTIKKKIAKLIGEEFWVEKNGVEFMRIYGFHRTRLPIRSQWRSCCFCAQEMGNLARSN